MISNQQTMEELKTNRGEIKKARLKRKRAVVVDRIIEHNNEIGNNVLVANFLKITKEKLIYD